MLSDIKWTEDRSYKTGTVNEPFEFYFDCLINSNRLDLLLGYFSSSAINVLSTGFASFLYRGGKVRMVINDVLSGTDKSVLIKGKDGNVDPTLINLKNLPELKTSLDVYDQHFFDCISWLIAKDRIEFTIVRPKNSHGTSHYKSGLFSDGKSEIAFNATCNFTASGLLSNLESLKVYDPQDGAIAKKNIQNERTYFDDLFYKRADFAEYVETKDVIEAIVKVGSDKTLDELLIKEKELFSLKVRASQKIDLNKQEKVEQEINRYLAAPRFPFDEGPRDYQVEAYKNWIENDFHGIFAMATGTGKTITSLNCLLEEYKNDPNEVYQALVLVPTITLVEQWKEEASLFNFKRVITISSKNKWENELATLLAFAKRIPTSFIIICTYASFTRDRFKKYLHKLPKSTVLIADEAHNIGSSTVLETLPKVDVTKKIGLSATPKRVYDPEGTAVMENFFNDQEPYTYSYSMDKAITNGVLCRYDYFPHLVKLTSDELEEYIELSKKISRIYASSDDSSKENEIAEALLLKRKRIIHKATNKLGKTLSILRDRYKNEGTLKYTFVYVPEGKNEDVSETGEELEEESRIINQYTAAIGKIDDSIFVNTFISGMKNRDMILEQFKSGDIHVIASMKCLDEGVDIPRAEHAIFCSSTGNPRQFIQRRGRILRKHPDKSFATIHDLIVIPEIEHENEETFETEKRLVTKELERVMYFASLSKNPYFSEEALASVCKHYGLNLYTIYNDLVS
jgi:superfamily II DNA or RNA helicase